MAFQFRRKVRFGDVDAAAIVFYPRYFDMLNDAVDDWFASMGMDFFAMHRTHGIGVPTVHLECDFLAPSELGDELTIELTPVEIGRSSCTLDYVVRDGDEVRLKAKGVLVCMDLTSKRPMAWPSSLLPHMNRARAALAS